MDICSRRLKEQRHILRIANIGDHLGAMYFSGTSICLICV